MEEIAIDILMAVLEVIAASVIIVVYGEFMFIMKGLSNQGIINQVIRDFIIESGGPDSFLGRDEEEVNRELQKRLRETFELYGLDEFLY